MHFADLREDTADGQGLRTALTAYIVDHYVITCKCLMYK